MNEMPSPFNWDECPCCEGPLIMQYDRTDGIRKCSQCKFNGVVTKELMIRTTK